MSSGTNDTPKSVLQKLLDWVERAGNKVTHPACCFFC
jgi:p-aminobenzoyl-glutamate transporter AbgT